jgi:hypothetical protein
MRLLVEDAVIKKSLPAKFTLKLAFFGSMVLLVTACGNPLGGSAIDTGHDPGGTSSALLSPAKGSELVSSSFQMKKTTGGKFMVEGAIGSPANKIKLTTTKGNILFSNVQGEIISDGGQ